MSVTRSTLHYASSSRLHPTLYSVLFFKLGTFVDFKFESLLRDGAFSDESYRNIPFGPFFAC